MKLIKTWINAARPRTLTASISPVLVATALAYIDKSFNIFYSLLCIFIALFGQIASNFANEYFDFKNGADRDERIGPLRSVSKGLITPKSMLIATFIMLTLTCISGLLLVSLTDFRLIFVGIAIILGVIAYSAGPFPLSYNGLGDISVMIFYGIIPVCFTYYVQTGAFPMYVFLYSIAMGSLSVNILVVNNYRDYEEDKTSKKKTTIVLFGRTFGKYFYIINQLIAVSIIIALQSRLSYFFFILLFAIIFYMLKTYRQLLKYKDGKLNIVLTNTAKIVFLAAILIAITNLSLF